MKYYSLTVKNNYGKLHAGECFCNAIKPMSIGQLNTSNIVLPCADDLLPQNFCTIKGATSGSWILIKQTDFYPIKVNDNIVSCVCRLNTGDIISMGGVVFEYKVHEDGGYSEAHGIVKTQTINTKLLIGACTGLLMLIAIICGGFFWWHNVWNEFTDKDEESIQLSVFKIEVGKFLYQINTPQDKEGVYSNVDSCILDSVFVGTCFYTTDSLLVTARHCVEPWVDFYDWGQNIEKKNLPQYIQWVINSETSQLLQADTLYRVISQCRVLDGDSLVCEFTSDKCSFNRSRDILTTLGDEQLPWRFLYPLYSRRDVELGDFAFLKSNIAGKLDLAVNEDLNSVDGKMYIYGYPKTNHGNNLEHEDVRSIILPKRDSDGNYSECIELNVHGTNGYSGSPVIEKKNGKLKVIGIFSKEDDYDPGTFYAVPANEVSQYNPKTSHENNQYR